MNKVLDVPADEIDISITNGQWFRAMKDNLIHPDTISKVNIVSSFHATLRTYQENGYQWLYKMSHLGFGACLADDMGLGKTVQMIAFLEYQRVNKKGPALLILPASLIGNWQKEIEKFAPEMTYQILHKSDLKNAEEIQIREGEFLYIT